MQYLKALVIGMGVLIVVGIGLLAYGLVSKTSSKYGTEGTWNDARVTSFGEIALAGNTGCLIKQTIPDGRWLVLHLSAADDAAAMHCQKIVIIDMSKGMIIGTVALKP